MSGTKPPGVTAGRPSWGRHLRRGLLALLGLLLFLSAALGGRAWYGWAGERQLADLEADLDRDDPGWRWPDLRDRQGLPPEANAALLVEAACRALPGTWPGRPAAEPPGPGALFDRLTPLDPAAPTPPELAAEIRAEWAALEPAVLAARRLNDGPGQGAYALDWIDQNPRATPIPHLALLPRVTHLLVLDAFHLAEEGRGAEALAAARGVLGVARSLGDELPIASRLNDLVCCQWAVRVVERTLGQTAPPGPALAQTQDLLQRHRDDLPGKLRATCRAERAIHHHFYTNLRAGTVALTALRLSDLPAEADAAGRGMNWAYVQPQLVHAQVRGVVETTRLLAILHAPEAGHLRALDQYEQHLRCLSRRLAGPFVPVERAGLLLMPSLVHTAKAQLLVQARLDCAILALAAERYRTAAGHYPDGPAALVPDYLAGLPRDPFAAGEPYGWRVLPDGLIIYSVGPDTRDDGGHIIRDRQGPAPLTLGVPDGSDVGFRLWRPDRRRQAPKADAEP